MGLLSTIGSASGRAFGLTRVGAAIKDAYFNLTTLLLNTGSTNGAQNNTFLDSSSNNFSITRNGNTTQGTFTPFSQTGWSQYFTGTANSTVGFSAQSAFAFGTGDFTIEGWFYSNTTSTGRIIVDFRPTSTNGAYPQLSVSSTNTLDYFTNSSTVITGGSVAANSWNHFALSRVSGSSRLFLNGGQVGSTYTDSTNYLVGTGRPQFGNNGFSDGNYWSGYMSNIRIIKGQGLFNGTFTPSTSPLTTTAVGATGSGAASSITGTVSLLFMQSNRFVDVSNATTINFASGFTGSIQSFSPFAPTAAYDAAVVGGSGYFDGTGDYLSAASNAAFAVGANTNFTIEAWIYLTSAASSNVIYQTRVSGGLTIGFNAGALFIAHDGVANVATYTYSPPINTWIHIAAVRNGTGTNNTVLYVNGVSVGTGSDNGAYAQGAVYISYNQSVPGWFFPGYISGLRFVNGSAVYTAAFTPPTAPPTAITNTQLLLSCTNAGIYDAASKNDLETVGNAQVSTTQAKFGTTSMAFDGTGDYLVEPTNVNYGYGTGDFTIEFWVYFNNVTSNQTVVSNLSSASSVNPHLYIDGVSNTLRYFTNNADRITSSALSSGQWYHITICRSGSSTKLFINGTQSGSTYTDANNYGASAPLGIGTYWSAGSPVTTLTLNGYIDEVRISKYARYTANFTAPTAAFPVQ